MHFRADFLESQGGAPNENAGFGQTSSTPFRRIACLLFALPYYSIALSLPVLEKMNHFIDITTMEFV